MKRLTLIAIALAASTSAAGAYDYGGSGRIDARQERQSDRIARARRNGELTRYEASRLWAEQARIRALERWAKRDGYVSGYEARRIERAQDAASRHIYQESHDGQRGWRRWY